MENLMETEETTRLETLCDGFYLQLSRMGVSDKNIVSLFCTLVTSSILNFLKGLEQGDIK